MSSIPLQRFKRTTVTPHSAAAASPIDRDPAGHGHRRQALFTCTGSLSGRWGGGGSQTGLLVNKVVSPDPRQELLSEMV